MSHSKKAGKYADVVSRMTSEEKASLTSGAAFWETNSVERLGVPPVTMNDGPHGLRKQLGGADHLGLMGSVPATSFPTAATLANSWDDQLLYKVGEAIASEAAEEDVNILLGPGLNIKRNPLGGRNFEYFSEDPLLSGKLAAAFIRGVQSVGVGACPKHFAVNSQETYRMSIDEVVDERALHEIYLEGFRIAIDEGKPWTLMTSYNKINGVHAHEHPELLGDILRDQWGYDGTLISDWGGNVDSAAALTAGANLEMPGSGGIGERRVLQALETKELDEDVLDQRLTEYLTLVERIQDDKAPSTPLDFDEQHRIAKKAAEQSLVLLRNDSKALPLRSTERIAVIGDFAKTARYQGAGSSLVNPTKVISALEAFEHTQLNLIGYEPGFKRSDKPSKRLADKALKLASNADTVLLFLGLDEGAESEAVDRPHMRLAKNQLSLTRALIDQAKVTGTKLVVVVAGGSAIEMPFADHVDAILHSYLPGQAGGEAIIAALEGRINPSGKLAESYPYAYEDAASAEEFGKHDAAALHKDSLYVGYRYYDKVEKPVRYPFGYGLSYTTFRYSNPRAEHDGDRGAPTKVFADITNTGDVAGAEVVQLYVAPVDSYDRFRPAQALAGYAKVALIPGETKTVEIDIDEHAFSVYDPERGRWTAVSGDYELRLAASSRDVREVAVVSVNGETQPDALKTLKAEGLTKYRRGQVQDVTDEEFEELLGSPLPPVSWDLSVPLDADSVIGQLPGHSALATSIHKLVTGGAASLDLIGRPIAANYARFLLAMPIRNAARMSGGKIDEQALETLVAFLNGEGLSWLRAKK